MSNLSLLRSFVEVYRQGTISGAADVLGLTQPSVTNHVAALEALLERKLFVRHPRGMTPTPVADDLARRTAGALDRAENALAETRARSTLLSGTLRLCGPSDILSDMLTQSILRLARHNLSIHLHPAPEDEILPLLVNGGGDFAFGVGTIEDKRIDSMPFRREDLFLVAAPEMADRINSHGALETGLTETPFVSYAAGNRLLRDWLDHNALDVGRAAEVAIAPDLRCLRNLVVAGLGWSVLPSYLVQDPMAQGNLRRIPGPGGDTSAVVLIYWLKSAMRTARMARARELLLM